MTQEVRISYVPQDWQARVHLSKARFRVVVAGVRVGKTKCAVHEMLWQLGKPGAKCWWVSPSWSETLVGWRMFLDDVPRQLIVEINQGEKFVRTINNSWCWWKSAEDYEHLRAEGLDFVVLDEAARMKRDAWFECIRPRLSDKLGGALFLTTPKGINWLYELYMLGKVEGTGWECFHVPTWEANTVSMSEIEDARKELPELLFLQEYGGEFLPDLGAVFRFRRDVVSNQILNIKGGFEPPMSEKQYFAGADLGKRGSYTVLFVLDQFGHVVAFDRFKSVDWTVQVQRIVNLCSPYNAKLVVDSSGLGDPVFDNIRKEYSNVFPYTISEVKKRPLIDNLAIMIEQVEVTFPEIPELLHELQVFGIERGKAGRELYRAPSGFNDDCVVGLALAVWSLRRQGGLGASFLDW